MACFLLRSPAGERWMEEQVNYTLLPGEAIVAGAINWNCGRNATPNTQHYRKCSGCGELGIYEST